MNDQYSSPVEAPIRGDGTSVADSVRDCWETLERRTEERPALYLGMALLLGFTLQVLPIRSIVWALIRLGAFLLKPALLAFGVWKLSEIVAESRRP
jgi:hypothetical protein